MIVFCFVVNLVLIIYDLAITIKEAYIAWKNRRKNVKKHDLHKEIINNLASFEGKMIK